MAPRLSRQMMSIAIVLGGAAGVARGLYGTDQVPCEYNMCFLTAGNCDVTSHPYSCSEVTGGCKDNACPLPTPCQGLLCGL
jgi:hypothetical protein